MSDPKNNDAELQAIMDKKVKEMGGNGSTPQDAKPKPPQQNIRSAEQQQIDNTMKMLKARFAAAIGGCNEEYLVTFNALVDLSQQYAQLLQTAQQTIAMQNEELNIWRSGRKPEKPKVQIHQKK